MNIYRYIMIFVLFVIIADVQYANSSGLEAIYPIIFDDTRYLSVARVTDIAHSIGTQWGFAWDSANFRYADWQNQGIKWYRNELNDSENLSYIDGDKKIEMHRNIDSLLAKGIQPYIVFSHFDKVDTNDFTNLCGSVATEFGNQIKYWEIGNEPHNSGFQDKWNSFASYFNNAAKKIKNINPNAKILSPGDDGTWIGGGMPEYMPLINKNVDILAIHPYATQDTNPGDDPTPEGLYGNRLKPFIDIAKQDSIKEIWVTEDGWSIGAFSSEGARNTSDSGQAKYLLRCIFYFPLSYGIKVFTQYAYDSRPPYSMSTNTSNAYNNLHSIFYGSDSTVSTQSFNYTAIQISKVQGYTASQIEQYMLVKNSNKIFVVYWLRIRQQDNFQKQNINITLNFHNALTVTNVKSYDVLKSNIGNTTSFNQSGKKVVIQNAQIADYPNIIEMTLQ